MANKSIVFRPLRRIKKTRKVCVAAYMQWHRVKTADYNEFELIIDNEYKHLPLNEFVYDHTGRQLFWRDFDPSAIPVFNYSPVETVFNVASIQRNNSQYAINWNSGYGLQYRSHGLDCEGVPAFSHYTADYVAEQYFKHTDEFEPLTVGIVVKWFGWFLYQLEKSHLQFGKQ